MHKRREHYIIGRALYEAVCRLKQLPEDQRPQSDIDDMIKLLNSRYGDVLDVMCRQDGRPIVSLVPRPNPPDDPA